MQGASLYAHVTSKEDLLWSIVDRAATAFEAAADAALAESATRRRRRSPGGIRRGPRRGRDRRTPNEPACSSPNGATCRRPAARRSRGRRDAYEGRLRELIVDGIALGAFRATDPALAATFLLTALNGIATWYRPDGRLSADRIADHYVDLALRSLSEDHR